MQLVIRPLVSHKIACVVLTYQAGAQTVDRQSTYFCGLINRIRILLLTVIMVA